MNKLRIFCLALMIVLPSLCENVEKYDEWISGNDLHFFQIFEEDVETHCYDLRVRMDSFITRILHLGERMLNDEDAPVLQKVISATAEHNVPCHHVENSRQKFERYAYYAYRTNWKRSDVNEMKMLLRLGSHLCTLFLNTTDVDVEHDQVIVKLLSPKIPGESVHLESRLSHHSLDYSSNYTFYARVCRTVGMENYNEQIFIHSADWINGLGLRVNRLRQNQTTLHVTVNNGAAYLRFQNCTYGQVEGSMLTARLIQCKPITESRPLESLRLKNYSPDLLNGNHRAEFFVQIDGNQTIVMIDELAPRRRVQQPDISEDCESLLQLLKRDFVIAVEVPNNETHSTTTTEAPIPTTTTPTPKTTTISPRMEMQTAENDDFSVDWALLTAVVFLSTSLLFNISLVLAQRVEFSANGDTESAQIITSFSNELFEA